LKQKKKRKYALKVLAEAMMTTRRPVLNKIKSILKFSVKALVVLTVLTVFMYFFTTNGGIDANKLKRESEQKAEQSIESPMSMGQPVPLEQMLKQNK